MEGNKQPTTTTTNTSSGRRGSSNANIPDTPQIMALECIESANCFVLLNLPEWEAVWPSGEMRQLNRYYCFKPFHSITNNRL